MSRLLLSVLGCCLLATPTCGAEAEVKIGTKIDKLTFKDIRYLTRSLDDFPDARAFVLVFTETGCPVVQRYWPTLKRLEKEVRAQKVQFLAINCNSEDSITAMAAQGVRYEIEFPLVKDLEQRCVKVLGVTRTPEVVVLDQERNIRYRGRIDDQYRPGGSRPAPTRHDLKEALTAVLAGKEVVVKETAVDGCLITHTGSASTKTPITYAEHIAPLMQKHCQECHRPKTPAPFSLLTYKQVASRADMIAEVVSQQSMPPWFASPENREFVNHRGLDTAERETIKQWAKAGAPRGDEKKLPRAMTFPDTGRWLIGQPDLVLSTADHELPAEGDIPYRYVFLTHVFLNETWVQGIQILPDNPRVVHHCNMAYATLGEKFSVSNFLTGFVPGGQPMTVGGETALRIPAGAMLVLQIHFVSTGKPEKCKLSVGFKYAQGTIQKRLRNMLLADHRFAIPPGAAAHPVSASKALDHDAVGIGLFCHMHLRGKDMTFKAHYPNGKSETLLMIPNYSFDWQMGYRWRDGQKVFPKGTRLECVAHYDNSPFNPFNPDPKATVRDGPQTYHEMMNGFVFYTDANEKLNLKIDPRTGRVKK